VRRELRILHDTMPANWPESCDDSSARVLTFDEVLSILSEADYQVGRLEGVSIIR